MEPLKLAPMGTVLWRFCMHGHADHNQMDAPKAQTFSSMKAVQFRRQLKRQPLHKHTRDEALHTLASRNAPKVRWHIKFKLDDY